MTGEQFELFPRTNENTAPVQPSGGQALLFPIDRQIAYVIKIARALDGREERLAAKYWRTECNRLTARLQVQGFDASTIRAELVRFGNAVAMHRSQHGRQRPTGGAA